jgi:hypothetical protein
MQTLDPWTCDDCGHVNAPDSPVCHCYFWLDDLLANHGLEITTSEQLAERRRKAFADTEAAYQAMMRKEQ